MYIGPWQEYELAKMLSSRRRLIESAETSSSAKPLIPLTESNRCMSSTPRAVKHSRPFKVKDRLARIENMRLLYQAEQRPNLCIDPLPNLNDDDIVDWSLNLNLENIYM